MSVSANPFLDPALARGYEEWYETAGRRADRQEKAILRWALGHFPGARSILEVGCGTGHFTRWFAEQGFEAVGADISMPMLKEAIERGSGCYVLADAAALPFAAGAFDLVAFVTAVEFIPDVETALREAARLARRGLVLGVLNAASLLGWQRKRSGLPLWRVARFFRVDELEVLLGRSLGRRLARVAWRTTLWPCYRGALPLPWGGFIAMVAILR